ncbi:hypothetical protein, partial [Pseudomonas sp. TAE6080]|uniref:hypothetical protein n=1 Tax=Pseudomonas sp. TAE6080 TaxID=2840374 RepID=UPI001C006EFF
RHRSLAKARQLPQGIGGGSGISVWMKIKCGSPHYLFGVALSRSNLGDAYEISSFRGDLKPFKISSLIYV